MSLIQSENTMQAKAAAALPFVAAPESRQPAAGEPRGGSEIEQRFTAWSATAPDRRADSGLRCEFDGGVVAKKHRQARAR